MVSYVCGCGGLRCHEMLAGLTSCVLAAHHGSSNRSGVVESACYKTCHEGHKVRVQTASQAQVEPYPESVACDCFQGVIC